MTFFLTCIAALRISAQQAQEPISADRPGFADGAATVGQGVAQVEIGVNADSDVVTLPALLRFGFSDAFELRVESDVVSDEGDLAPVAVGFKWRLTQGAIPLSIIASVQPPSGEGSLRASDFESEVRLVSDIDLGNDFTLTPNAGVALGEGGERSEIFALTLEKELGNVLPFVDFEAQHGEGDRSLIADAGVAWIVGNDTQLDVSGGFGLAGDAYPDWFVSAGYSRRF